MESRLFRLFCERYHLPSMIVNRLFNENSIWSYIEQTYDTLHLNGDESALTEIAALFQVKGIAL